MAVRVCKDQVTNIDIGFTDYTSSIGIFDLPMMSIP